MKAALLLQPGQPISVENVELDGPRENEVRVRIAASGLCHSDYHLLSGDIPLPLPAILGHEAAGYVEAIGPDVRGFEVGDLVVSAYSAYCGECLDCQTGQNYRCTDKPAGPRREAGSRMTWKGKPVYQLAGIGGFAEEMVVHQRSLVKVPRELPPQAAALLGCGVLTGVGAVVNGARIKPGSRVAVVGCGGVGLNVVQGARIAGAADIIAIDIHPEKLELARQFGATAGILAGPDAVREVLELTDGGVDFAFEVIGSPEPMREAFLMLRRHGTAVLVGLAKAGADLSVPALNFVRNDNRIIGSGMGDAPFQIFVPQLARMYLEGRLQLDELVSRRIGLHQVNEGFAAMERGEGARNVIVFD